MVGGWNPTIQCRHRDPEIAGDIARRHSAREQLLCRLDFAVGHLSLSTAFASELACDFKPGSGSFDDEFPLHLSQAGHDVEKETSRSCSRVDGIGQALELDSLLLKLSDEID